MSPAKPNDLAGTSFENLSRFEPVECSELD